MTMLIAWHASAFEVPDNWEVTRYSLASQEGRLEFTGRSGHLAVFSWKNCTRPPDEKRIIDEYHRKYLKEFDKKTFQSFPGFDAFKIGIFTTGIPSVGTPIHAVAHIPSEGKLAMWNFPDYSKEKLESLWKPILNSFLVNDGAIRRWAMFGIRCMLPRDFEVEEASCRPADAWIEFERKNLHKVVLHRWGLPRELLRQRSLEEFFKDVVRGHEGRILNSSKEMFRGMESLRVSTEVKGTQGMDRLYAARWPGTGRIWHDTGEKRIYAWLQYAPKKIELFDEKELIPA